MNKEEKIQFVLDLTSLIAKKIIEKIENNKVPDYWDGPYLRELLADNMNMERTTLMKTDKKLKKQYISDVYMNSL